MNRSILMFLLMLAALPAWADKGDQYLIGRVGLMQIKLNNADPAYAAGMYYGYGLWRDLSLELEGLITLTGGDYSTNVGKGKYQIWTVASYAVYRVPVIDKAYLKLKAGYLYEDVSSGDNARPIHAYSWGYTGGLGLGYSFLNGTTIEAEFSGIEQDVYFYGLGMHYQF